MTNLLLTLPLLPRLSQRYPIRSRLLRLDLNISRLEKNASLTTFLNSRNTLLALLPLLRQPY
jgi:hypothetical protein